MSQRKERYGRLTVLLSGCVTKWARNLVLKCVKDSSPSEHEPYPWEVKHFLKHNRGKSLRSNYERQMDKLFNRGKNVDTNIEEWDLQLCCFILEEICHLPSSMAEDIKYVRKVRNQLCHVASPELPDNRYEKYMGRLSHILQTGLTFINDVNLKEEITNEFDYCKKGLFTLDMNKCTDMNKKWREQEADLCEIKHDLDQDDREELMAVRRRDRIPNQPVPEATVDLVLTGCTDDNRNNISELLVSLFDEKLSKNTAVITQLSQEHLQCIREAVSAAVTSLMSDGKEIISAEKKCISLTIRCDSFVNLASLLEECVTGKMTKNFEAVAVALRKAYGYCDLRVVIYENEFWKCIIGTDPLDETGMDTTESRSIGYVDEKGTGTESTGEHEKGSCSPSIDGSDEQTENQAEQQEFEIAEKCQIHTNKLVECFCSHHDELCCTICVISKHAKCGENIIYIPIEVRDTNVKESPELKMVTNKLNALTERTIYNQSRIKLNREAITAYRRDTKSYINQLQKEMNDRFERMKCDVDEELDDFQRVDMDSMEALELYCSSILNILARERKEIDEVRKGNNMCQLYITMKKQKVTACKLEQQVNDIENKNEINRYEFQPDSKLVDLIQGKSEDMGRIVVRKAKTYKTQHVIDIDITEEGNVFSKYCISGMTFLSDERVVASDSENKQIELISVKESKVNSVVLLTSSPADLTTIDEKEIVVALPDANSLQFVTITDTPTLKIDRRMSVDQACHGVAYHDSMLFVSFIPRSYMRPSTIQILDMSGKALKSLYQTWTGSPGYLTVNSSTSTLYMSDRYNATVTSLSLDGTIKAVFSNKDIQQPNGITHDSEGYVYVCDRKTNNIIQLSSDCKLVQILEGLGSEVSEPVSLAFCKVDQRMYVGMNNSNVIKSFYLI